MKPRHARRVRRGVTLLVVLLVVSLGLAVSYAVLHSQGATIQLQRNSDRHDAARQAAVAGLTTALRQMHLAGQWKGVDSLLTGSLNGTDSYAVSFSVGDASLTASDPDHSNFPFRVTLLSTGYARDASSVSSIATYKVRAVVRLVPKQLATEPAGFSTLSAYTVYQWRASSSDNKSQFVVEVPSRTEGKVRIQRKLELCESDPDVDVIRQRLLHDLNALRAAGKGDDRPFNAELHLPFSETLDATRSLLTADLGLPLVDKPSTSTPGWEHPGEPTSYQLFHGGPTYKAPTVGPQLENVTLEPDPRTNPLGLFCFSGTLTVSSNVTVRGTLISSSDGSSIIVEGQNVRLESVSLPPLDGTTSPVQLPLAIVADDLHIRGTAKGSMSGTVYVWDQVEFDQGPQANIDFTLAGRLVTKELLIHGRDEWSQNNSWWSARYAEFVAQESIVGGTKYFPTWLEAKHKLVSAPRVRIQPSASAVTHHWKNNADPIYVPHTNDEGLRWDLVEWTEDPK